MGASCAAGRILPGLVLAFGVWAFGGGGGGFGAVSAAFASDLRGRVDLVSARSGRAARGVNVAETVVAFVPDERVAPRVPAQPYQMATVRKGFEPEQLLVPVGGTVVFPNFDPILHNVFSVSAENPFDLGLYGRGEGKTVTFTQPGIVRVFCNVHQTMFGTILVLATPFHGQTDSAGEFSLEGVPGGKGRLLVWHPQAEPRWLDVRAPASGYNIRLEVQRRRVPTHLNKFGKPYRSRRDRYNR